MKYLQKSLALFLCIVMCLSFFPLSAAFAEETESMEEEPVPVEDELVHPSLQDNNSSEDQEELPHEHNYTAVVTEPTCTERGFTTYICDCGDSYVDDDIEALNHPEIIDVPEVPATETEPGTTAGKKCVICGEILEGSDEITALVDNNFAVDEKTNEDELVLADNDISDLVEEETEEYCNEMFRTTANFSGQQELERSMSIYSATDHIYVGEKNKLTFEVLDSNIKESDILNLDWFIDDTSIAEFESIPSTDSWTAIVVGKEEGRTRAGANITYSYLGDVRTKCVKCSIYVGENTSTFKFEFSGQGQVFRLNETKTVSLIARNPSKVISIEKITWEITDTSVATFVNTPGTADQTVQIKGLKEGNISIFANVVYNGGTKEGYGNKVWVKNSESEPSDDSQAGIRMEDCFPDPVFRAYVLENFDTDQDGALSDEEIAAVNSINVESMGIESLNGVGMFSELKNLNCRDNHLTELDLSANEKINSLECGYNRLTSLDLSHNPELTGIGVRDNQLTMLDVSCLPGLKTLGCGGNQLVSLDLSHNHALRDLYCWGNRLTELDVSECKDLQQLFCYNNQLKNLDLCNLSNLRNFNCDNNQLTSLDLSANTQLETFVCDWNQLNQITLGRNEKLYNFGVRGNWLTGIDVSGLPNLQVLGCGDNRLTSIDLSHNPKLYRVHLFNNRLTELDVSSNPELVFLQCHNNVITELNVGNCSALVDLIGNGRRETGTLSDKAYPWFI